MKRRFLRSLVIGLLFVVAFYAFQMIYGMILTVHYVPDVVESYESVDALQPVVAFGHEANGMWRTVLETAGPMLLGIVVYYVSTYLRSRKK